MTDLLQAIVNGSFLASIYALIALGFVVVFKATGLVNLAQPVLLAAGAYLTSYLTLVIGLPFYAAFLAGALGAGLLAVVTERIVVRPMVGQPPISAVMVTVGLFIAGDVIVDDFIGTSPRAMGDPWGLGLLELGEVDIFHRTIAAVIVVAVVVAALLYFFNRTRLGIAMRATSFDQEAALAHGIPVGRVFSISWGIAGVLAALAGVLYATGGRPLSTETAFVAFLALPVIILGGLDSIGGAIIGAIIIGMIESFVVIYQPDVAPWLGARFTDVVPYAVMLIVLLIRPYGLFGTPEIERV